jgi:hypothetical protein
LAMRASLVASLVQREQMRTRFTPRPRAL